MAERDEALREVRQLEYVWIPLRDGARLAARIWLPDGRRGRPGAGHPRGRALPAERRHGHARRRSSTRTGPAHGYACVRVDLRGSGESDGVLRGRVPPAGAGGPARGHRLDRRPALVHRRRRHDRHLVGRLQQPPAGRPPPAGAQGDHHAHEHRRPLRRRRALQGRLRAGHRPAALEHVHAALAVPAAARGRPSASAGASCGEQRLEAQPAVDPHLARAPAPRRLLEARLGVRGLRRHRGPRLRRRRLDRRLHQRRPAPARGPARAAQGPHRPVAARVPAHASRRARPSASCRRRCAGGTTGSRAATPASWTSRCCASGCRSPCRRRRWMDEVPGTLGRRRTSGRRRASSRDAGGWTRTACCATPRRGARRMPRRPPRTARTAAASRIRGAQLCGADAGAWCAEGQPSDSPPDQRAAEGQSLCFTSAPLAEPLEILGHPRLTLRFASDRPLALVAARLDDVAPDGVSRLVTHAGLQPDAP